MWKLFYGTLGLHIESKHNKPSYTEPFPCEVCGLVLANFNLLQEHMNTQHSQAQHNCRYCDFRGGDAELFESHLVESHEEYVILHSMAKQVEDLSDRFTQFEHLKLELSTVLKSLFDNQNIIKQEMFVIRNDMATLASKPQTRPEPVQVVESKQKAAVPSLVHI